MKLRTHLAIGAGVSSLLASFLISNMDSFTALVFFAAVASLLPDIDSLFSPLFQNAHRSPLSHSLVGSVLLSSLIVAATIVIEQIAQVSLTGTDYLVILSVCLASCISHPLLDSLTIKGVVLLWPFSRRRYRGSVRYDNVIVNSFLVFLGLALFTIALMRLTGYLF
ncbi:MAG: metal-dependent hydrolase [Thermoplasmata archaeon]|nr:metal-dependent hydrolase [Thermoplasmata archaeon]